MRLTKNMYYKETEASNELSLYAVNDASIYFDWILPTIRNLRKHLVKGKWNPNKAVWSFYRVACESAKRYNKEIDSTYKFPVQARWTVAEVLLEYYMEDIEAIENEV